MTARHLPHDAGPWGFSVRRALPLAQRQMVGPPIFFDQMGPSEFLLGNGLPSPEAFRRPPFTRSHPRGRLISETLYKTDRRLRSRLRQKQTFDRSCQSRSVRQDDAPEEAASVLDLFGPRLMQGVNW